ncbi:MAG TPA: response regulator [Gemmatimonadales bacterium]|nr:response regulator [Gemmatimonadales bacterium]
MSTMGRILLADDETVFAEATADLLRREGYDVDTVGDAPAAIAATEAREYDLVISDLEMPGNDDLALLRRLAESRGGLPVIVVTGYPSTRSAMVCIDLPVAAYLTKPIDFTTLRDKSVDAIRRYRAWQAMRQSEARAAAWRDELASLAEATPGGAGVDSFLALTLRNVMGSITDLQQIGQAAITGTPKHAHACQIINCPRGAQLTQAIKETVEILESTKGSFKSKALGDLRHKLELLLSVS